MKLTKYHSKYYANLLTLQNSSKNVNRLSQSIFDAKIDINPHQVEAALFAFKSPLSNGVLLADEVGLGKTIEAGLVLCQYWSERKRKIIIVVPASLRKQWSVELKEKFFIDSIIIDGKIFKEELKKGNNNPFVQKDKVVITSYPFASRKEEFIYLANFQLAVIDEAHKLRNFHRGEKAKTTFAIVKALRDTKKVLLTATPLQNSLLELFGIISVIDEWVFGDKKSFRQLFSSQNLTGSELDDLRERLKPVCHRSLRKDVTEYIKYTKRIAIVEEFTPNKNEVALYEMISNFLLDDNRFAIPKAQKTLITLVARKLLASSTRAITGTLTTLIKRLNKIIVEQKVLNDSHLIDDEEELIDNYYEENEEDDECSSDLDEVILSNSDIQSIKKEIGELETFIELAKSIEIDTKVKSLMSGLYKGFVEQKKLGIKNHKALIFTESRRTQEFLFEHLSDNGFKDKVVLFNGTNNDPKSKEIYKEWLITHEGSDKITGSKASDVKQAIVDYFRNSAEIMIATEAGSEGVNLQFCNMLINYDLPWNPQRIEQRIGRVHRYGQKFDVVVINFLNKKNAADRRVYELLSEKFNLFSGVFGASDEVLGAIENGVDFEKRILEIYQTCRDDKTINNAFNKLQEEFKEKIDQKTLKTRQTLLDHFDEDVHLRLKTNLAKSNESLDRFSQIFWNITKFELAEFAEFNDSLKEFKLNNYPVQNIHKGLYQLISESRKKLNNNAYTYRLNSDLGQHLIGRATKRDLETKKLSFDLTNNQFKISVLNKFRRRNGFLRIDKIKINSYDTEEHLICTCLTDKYEIINSEIAFKILSLEAEIKTKSKISEDDYAKLNFEFNKQKEYVVGENEKDNQVHFTDASLKLHKWAEDRLEATNRELKETKGKIKELNRQSLQSENLEEQTEFQLQIKAQEKKRRTIQRTIFDIEEEIEAKRDQLIEELRKAKTQKIDIEELFTIEWEIV